MRRSPEMNHCPKRTRLSIDAVLQARVADWDVDDAAKAARQQEEWWDIGAAVVVILSLRFMYAKGPEILQWLWKIHSPVPPANSESAQQPATEAPVQASDNPLSRGPIKCRGRPRSSPATEHPPSFPENENRSS